MERPGSRPAALAPGRIRTGGRAVAASDSTARAGRGGVPDMARSYERYISSGLYDRRYPRANRRTLGRLLRHLPGDGRFLDFGAGTGRYTEPLLQLTKASGVACDICPTACRIMGERLADFTAGGRLEIRHAPLAALAGEFRGAFDLAFLAFGVLGHVSGKASRRDMLVMLRRMLKPGGVLIAGLPNRARRFRAEQRAARGRVLAGELEPGDVLYSRGRGAIPMFYHLFSPAEAREEFDAAGLHVDHMEVESMLAEEAVVSSPWLGRLDAIVSGLAPAGCGFGFLVVARPHPESGV